MQDFFIFKTWPKINYFLHWN